MTVEHNIPTMINDNNALMKNILNASAARTKVSIRLWK